MPKRATKRLSDQIRQAIDESGQTKYRIAKEIGMNESALGKFCNGQRGLSTAALDRLGEYLGLKIVAESKRKAKGK